MVRCVATYVVHETQFTDLIKPYLDFCTHSQLRGTHAGKGSENWAVTELDKNVRVRLRGK